MLTLRTSLLLLVLPVALTACDSAGPSPTVADWAGSYTGQSRFGSTRGTWGNGGTYPLVVSSVGQVTISGNLIVGGTYDPATGTFTWTRADGNATNGEVTFRSTTTSSTYFGDFTTDTAGQNFTGFIRLGSDGPLDYRGVLR